MKKENWEEELYDFYYEMLKENAKEFGKKPPSRKWLVIPILENLKPFISNLLSQSRQEFVEEKIKEIEGLKKEVKPTMLGSEESFIAMTYVGFNEAISQVLSILNRK